MRFSLTIDWSNKSTVWTQNLIDNETKIWAHYYQNVTGFLLSKRGFNHFATTATFRATLMTLLSMHEVIETTEIW